MMIQMDKHTDINAWRARGTIDSWCVYWHGSTTFLESRHRRSLNACQSLLIIHSKQLLVLVTVKRTDSTKGGVRCLTRHCLCTCGTTLAAGEQA